MFDTKLQFAIKKVSLKTKSKGGVSTKTIKLTLEREFDAVIAAGLGGDARAARDALIGGGMESCVMPIDAIDASASLSSGIGEVIDIRRMTGVTAKGSLADADFPPSIELAFDLPYAKEPWAFFGEYQDTTAVVTMTRRQLELAGDPVGKAIDDFRDAIPEGTSVTFRAGSGEAIGKVAGRGKKGRAS